MDGDEGTGEKRRSVDRLARALGLPVAALLALCGQWLLSTRGLPPLRTLAPGCALYLLAGALAVLTLVRGKGEAIVDLAGSPPVEDEPPRGRRRGPPPGLEWSLVALVVLGGLYLRLHRIDLIPWGLNTDEAINGIEVGEIVRGKPFASVTVRGLNRETMFHYLTAFSYRNPGLALNLLRTLPAESALDLQPKLVNDELMDLVFPLRSVAIAAGTLTLLAFYVFARDRFGWRVALLAALFLAVSPWHLLYSRVGFRVILAPLFAIAAVGLFLRALESGKWREHLACGAVVGFGFWTYTSFRVIPLALAVFLLLRRRIDPDGAASHPVARRPMLAGAGLALLALVLMIAFSHMGVVGFLGRGGYAAFQGRSAVLTNFLHALTMIHYFPAAYAVVQSDTFISDGVSAVYGLIGLEPETLVVAALASLGILYAFRRAARGRDPASALVLLCAASLLLTVGFAGPSLTRMLLNVPWICLLAALFAWRLFDDLAGLWRPFTTALAGAALLALAGLACVEGYDHYFLKAGRSDKAMQFFLPRQTIMGAFVRALPPDEFVYVLHSYGRETLTYLIGDRPDVHLVTDPSTLDLNAIGQLPRSATFILEYSEYSRPFAEVLRFLIMRYPQGEMTQVADARLDPNKVIFYTFSLHKDESGQTTPPPPS